MAPTLARFFSMGFILRSSLGSTRIAQPASFSACKDKVCDHWMVTVSGTEALTVAVPEGVVPLPLTVTIEVPGAAFALDSPFEAPQEVKEIMLRLTAKRKATVQKALYFLLSCRRRIANKNTVNPPGRKMPARFKADRSWD